MCSLFLSPGTGDITTEPVVDLLFLVIQGGATVHSEASVGRSIDYRTLRSNMTDIAELHFRSAVGRWALRQVPCPNLTISAFQTLCDVRSNVVVPL